MLEFFVWLSGIVIGYAVCYWQSFRWQTRRERMKLRRSRSRYADSYGLGWKDRGDG